MPKPAGKKEAWMKDFVRFELTKEQRDGLRKWFSSQEDVLSAIDGVCQDDYTLTVQRDWNNHAYVARLSIRDAKSKNSGLLLTGRGATSVKAVAEVLYKHGVLQGDWTIVPNDSDDSDW